MQYIKDYDCHKCIMTFETLESKAQHLETCHGITITRDYANNILTRIVYDKTK